METIQIIARAHYEAGSETTKVLARQFFNAMDADGDGQVNIDEFKEFMEIGHRDWFHFLDRDNSGALDFGEVLTLYYIMKSGRPFCGSCKQFVTKEYFACVQCYESPKPYCLCLRCYRSLNWAHNHNGCSLFLDNYALLEAMRKREMERPPCSSSSNQIVRPSNNINFTLWEAALKTFDVAVKVGNFGANLANQLGCSIM